MQFERLYKLLSSETDEDIILALKIIESKITLEHAIAAVCLIRRKVKTHNVPGAKDQYHKTLERCGQILAHENGKTFSPTSASPTEVFNYCMTYMRSKEDAEYALEWYQNYVNELYVSAIKLKLRSNYKTG